jgi:enamine deaminase RidA (YjgF/YER057c/UK114 family)
LGEGLGRYPYPQMIEHFNAPGLSDPPGYSHAVVASGGRLVVTAGAVPLDPDGNVVGHGDYATQTKQVLDNLGLALGAACARGEDVLKTTVYVVTEAGKIWLRSGASFRNRRWPLRRALSSASRCSATKGNWSRWRRSR